MIILGGEYKPTFKIIFCPTTDKTSFIFTNLSTCNFDILQIAKHCEFININDFSIDANDIYIYNDQLCYPVPQMLIGKRLRLPKDRDITNNDIIYTDISSPINDEDIKVLPIIRQHICLEPFENHMYLLSMLDYEQYILRAYMLYSKYQTNDIHSHWMRLVYSYFQTAKICVDLSVTLPSSHKLDVRSALHQLIAMQSFYMFREEFEQQLEIFE